ncbi:MAG: tRNA 4-thiouridine(8) synthase ThiI [Ruminococcaceae bacterium]|nr:tRNA 4-thiouridine(8) synthase ThiI [Oscillospiraceae bacterium]
MKEVLLCKYGELILKGANRSYFESLLLRELKTRVRRAGDFDIYRAQSTIYIEPKDDACDLDAALEYAKKVFGIVTIDRACVVEKNIDAIRKAAKEYLPQFLTGVRTFKADARRADKKFPMKSPELMAEVGAAVLEAMPRLKVDVNNPEVVVRVEIREYGAYIHAGQIKGAGGMPLGSSGKGLLLLSGGIDSPVAGWMMAKRGVVLEALHFESFPYTSERAKEKVLELAQLLCEYSTHIHVHVISLTHIQEELRRACDEDYFTLLLRRYMMTLAERVARKYKCGALITGESLAQVASQTMKAIEVTDNAVNIPVYRPCIGMDKEEIITIARKIGTFETSILPYEDCCTVFTPRHPRTRPELEKVLAEERKLDFEALCDEAFATLNTYDIRIDEE